MIRVNRVAVVLGLLLCAVAPAQAQMEKSRDFSTDLQFQAIQTIVRITVQFAERRVQGSGVCIGSDDTGTYFLTCAHVLKDADRATRTKIEFFSKQTYPTPCRTYTQQFSFWLDDDNDLALIRAPVAGINQIRICSSTANLKFKIPVLAVGCGKGASPAAQVGTFVGQDRFKDFVMNRGAIGGRSGGALISKNGLLGIIARGGNGRTVAVNIWKIHRFLKKTGHADLLLA